MGACRRTQAHVHVFERKRPHLHLAIALVGGTLHEYSAHMRSRSHLSADAVAVEIEALLGLLPPREVHHTRLQGHSG